MIPAIDNRNIAKTLNLGAWEIEPDKFSTIRLKLGGGLKHVGLMLPLPFTGAHNNCVRRRAERYPPGLSQVVLAAFLSEGHFARHLRRMRELYGARLGASRRDTERYLGGILKLPEIQAGLNTPAFLLNGMNSREACERAQRRGLEVWPLDRYAIVRKDLRGLILGFAAFNEREIRGGVTELARALAKS